MNTDLENSESWPGQQMELRESYETLRNLVDSLLPERLRHFVEQTYFEERPVKEVARRHEVTAVYVNTSLRAALRKLRHPSRISRLLENGLPPNFTACLICSKQTRKD